MPRNREFKKLRRLLQRKDHFKMEIYARLNVLRLFHVHHVVQNRRSALSLACHEWLSCKGKEWKVYCCELALSTEPQKWKFHVVIWQTTSKIAPKSVLHLQHDYFSSFNQSNHWFVVLLLTLIIFSHSGNQIIHLWRCRSRCCRHFLNSQIGLLQLGPRVQMFTREFFILWAIT